MRYPPGGYVSSLLEGALADARSAPGLQSHGGKPGAFPPAPSPVVPPKKAVLSLHLYLITPYVSVAQWSVSAPSCWECYFPGGKGNSGHPGWRSPVGVHWSSARSCSRPLGCSCKFIINALFPTVSQGGSVVRVAWNGTLLGHVWKETVKLCHNCC